MNNNEFDRNKRIYTIEYHQKLINDLITQIITKLNNVQTSTKIVELYNELTNEMIEIIKTNPDGYCSYNNEMKIFNEKMKIIQQIEDPDDYFNVDKPTKAQHLTMLFDEDMSQRDKVRIIAVHYECSEKTAERYMKKFGLWNKVKGTKTPKDNSPKPTADTSLFEDLSFNPSINTKNDFRL